MNRLRFICYGAHRSIAVQMNIVPFTCHRTSLYKWTDSYIDRLPNSQAVILRCDGDDASGASGTAFDWQSAYKDDRATGWQFVQIGQILQMIESAAERNSVALKILRW